MSELELGWPALDLTDNIGSSALLEDVDCQRRKRILCETVLLLSDDDSDAALSALAVVADALATDDIRVAGKCGKIECEKRNRPVP